MSALPPYHEYKSADSEWIDSVPAHWSVGRLDRVARVWTSNVDKHSVEGETAVRLCNYTDVYNHDSIVADMDFMQATASPDQIGRFRIAAGDTIITKDSETADDIGIPAYVRYQAPDLICGYHLAIVRPTPLCAVPRFLYWALASKATLRQWAVLASGVTRVGIRSNDLSKASLVLPPLAEQRAIADYLDCETARIDKLIAEQRRLVEMLQERRAAVVDNVVTHGLDADVATVETGVSWIGAVPAHWRIQPLWSLFRRIKDVNHPDEQMLSVFRDYGVVAKNSRDNLNKTAENRSIYQLVDPGWLVTNRMKAWQGSVGISSLRGIVSGHYICFAPRHDEDDAYLNWLFRSPRYAVGYGLISRGVRIGQAEIDNDDYRVLPVVLPPIDEQRRIATCLDEETSKIDVLIAESERLIELSRERRSALITAAVTGQIDVRDTVEAEEVA